MLDAQARGSQRVCSDTQQERTDNDPRLIRENASSAFSSSSDAICAVCRAARFSRRAIFRDLRAARFCISASTVMPSGSASLASSALIFCKQVFDLQLTIFIFAAVANVIATPRSFLVCD